MAGTQTQRRSLEVVREQISRATAAAKCHRCGCLHQTVAALQASRGDVTDELSTVLAGARASLVPKKYDCIGCAECFPAIAANAFTEAFPEAGAALDLCPTDAPTVRAGWPPLPGDYHVVRHGAPVAVCTLNDEGLARELADGAPEGLAIVGTLRTENLGIERLIRNTLGNPNLRCLVLCGEDTQQAIGHLPGQSLQALLDHGIDEKGRIRGARGKRPVLKNITAAHVDAFRRQVELVAMIGERRAAILEQRVRESAALAPGAFDEPFDDIRVPVVDAGEPPRLVLDPCGWFVVYPDARRHRLVVEHFTNAGVLDIVVQGATPSAVYGTIVARELVTRLDHAAYLGRELARAERSLQTGEPFVQDRAAGELAGADTRLPATAPPAASDCGCATACATATRERAT